MEESEEEEVAWKIFFAHPLFSCIITLYSLILLYFPQNFLQILLSPVPLITGALLVSLLRLGSTRDSDSRPGKCSGTHEISGDRANPSLEKADVSGFSIGEPEWSSCKTKSDMGSDQNPDFVEKFVEWNVRAPLDVIHEAYNEEEDGDDDESVAGEKDPTRFPSLSVCYPESDSDSSSGSDYPVVCGWVSPEEVRLIRWGEDDVGEGLIEIRLDEYDRCLNKSKQIECELHSEEESLIEIDLSP